MIGCSPRAGTPKSSTDNTAPAAAPASGEPVAPAPPAQPPPPTADTVGPAMAVGRALELGDVSKAQALSAKLDESAPALLVAARLAQKTEAYEDAVRIYHQMTDRVPEFENRRIESLADVLAQSERAVEAAGQLDILLQRHENNPQETYRLLLKKAEWLEDTEKQAAIAAYRRALPIAPKPKNADTTALALARLLLETKQPKEATTILAKLALEGNSGAIMNDAAALLAKYRIDPRWSAEQHLGRAKKLLKYRSFDAATAAADAVKGSAHQDDVAWLKANILFKRRRHYKEAAQALDAIVKKGGPYADEARFLAARALSRQDRDKEAITAYRAFARKTERRGKADYARFLAARLEFYLGRHKQALMAIEGLVGNGKHNKTGKLTEAGDRRDAHFLAGLSALLIDRPSQAIPHLTAASDGTRNEEVLKRNAYWLAVASAEKGVAKPEQAFFDLCSEDPTDWYAQMSAARLSKMKKALGPCELTPIFREPAEAPSSSHSQPPSTPDILALTEISPVAGLFAAAGLFKDAAEILRIAEKDDVVKRPAEEWIRHYVSLEAPHLAIKKAGREWTWPPTAETLDMARASYPTPYGSVVDAVEAKHDLPASLIYAIARKESLFDPHAVSWVGAMGMMQMMPHTYEVNRKRAGLPPLKKGRLPGPIESIQAAGEEFNQLFETFDGSLPLAIMAYNGGVAAVKRWVSRSGDLPLDVFVEKTGFAQTRNYVRRVTKNLVRYRLLAGKAPPALPMMVERPKAKTPN